MGGVAEKPVYWGSPATPQTQKLSSCNAHINYLIHSKRTPSANPLIHFFRCFVPVLICTYVFLYKLYSSDVFWRHLLSSACVLSSLGISSHGPLMCLLSIHLSPRGVYKLLSFLFNFESVLSSPSVSLKSAIREPKK